MLGEEGKYLVEESIRWGALLAVVNFALYVVFRWLPALAAGGGYVAAKIVLLFVVVGVVRAGLLSAGKRGVPMNKYVMALGIIFLAELLVFLFYRMVGPAGAIRSGLFPLPLAIIVALLTDVDSLPLVEAVDG